LARDAGGRLPVVTAGHIDSARFGIGAMVALLPVGAGDEVTVATKRADGSPTP